MQVGQPLVVVWAFATAWVGHLGVEPPAYLITLLLSLAVDHRTRHLGAAC